MFKAGARLKVSSTDALMLEDISPPLEELIWIQVFLNVKIAGNGNTPPYHAEFKEQNVSSATAHINPKTTTNLIGAAKQITRSIYHILKQKKVNCAHICSSVQITEVTIRQILTYVHSGNIGSTRNSTTKSILRSMETGPSQFAQLWAGIHNDL